MTGTGHHGRRWQALGLLVVVWIVAERAEAYSTSSNIDVGRALSPATAKPGQTVTVTLTVTVGAIGASPVRGFYLADAVPDSLAAGNHQVTLNGAAVTAKTETSASGAVFSGCKTVRWVLETPPAFAENVPIGASSTLKVSYEVTVPSTMASGTLSFPGFSWVAMIPALGDSGDNFGYEDNPAVLPVVADPRLELSPTAVSFSVQEGGSNPGPQSVTVSNAGGGTLAQVTATPSYAAGASGWLAVANSSGPGNTQVLENTVDLAGLAPNTYTATVAVSAPGASNSPQSYTVSFTVVAKPSTTAPTIALDPTTLQFTAEEDGSSPEPKNVLVGNSGAETLAAVTQAISYVDGDGWLQVTASGQDNAQVLENRVSPSGLAPNTYTATVAVSSAGASNTPQNYTVSFTVTPAPVTPDAGPADAGVGIDGPGVGGDANSSLALDRTLEGGCSVGPGRGSGTPAVLWILLALLWVGGWRRFSR